ncbi:DUF6216 family protein [Leclercia sp. AS011]|uniref:DUF6216 family protein n=1 Tax=Leclercia sp. AS011 TaxID=3081257 RepID=UPI00301AA564
MMNNLPVTELIIKEMVDSPIATIAAAITILAQIILLIRASVGKKVNAPDDIFIKNGISTRIMSFFAIKIPLNKTPDITKVDIIFLLFIGITSLTATLFCGNMFLKVANTPEHSTSLYFKATGENFYLSLQAASEAVAINKEKAWTVTPEKCTAPQDLPLTPSVGLVKFLCEAFNNEEYKSEIIKSIEKFKKDKPVIYVLLGVLEFSFLWILMSLIITIIYKARIRKYIINEHQIALSYVA